MSIIPNKKIPMHVVYRDEGLYIIDKPAALPVYPLKQSEIETVANGLLAMDPHLATIGPQHQAGIVHRLDNGTSGLLVVARTQKIYEQLRKIWTTGAVQKKYFALVLGCIKEIGTIRSPIAHHPRSKKKMLVCESKKRAEVLKARPAVTKYEPKKYFKDKENNPYTLVEVAIITGVRHQIRVHLASLGHPLAGDRLYQNPKKKTQDQTKLGHPFLHLGHLILTHPVTAKKITTHTNLPQELQAVLSKLQGDINNYMKLLE